MGSHAAAAEEEERIVQAAVMEILRTAEEQDGKIFPPAETVELIKDTATDATGQEVISV